MQGARRKTIGQRLHQLAVAAQHVPVHLIGVVGVGVVGIDVFLGGDIGGDLADGFAVICRIDQLVNAAVVADESDLSQPCPPVVLVEMALILLGISLVLS